jgi:PAS domain S-box-containing protein
MKISTRLRLAVFIPAIMALAIIIALVFSYQEMSGIQKTGDTVRQVRSSITELNHFVFSYILYHDERPKQQFLAEHEKLTQLLAGTQVRTPEQQRLLDNVHQNNDTMEDLFYQLTAAFEIGDTPEAEGRLVGLLLLKSYEADSNASTLRNIVDDGIRINEIQTIGLIFSVIVLATISLTFILVRTRRVITSSLFNLRKGTAVIGSGNLDFKIKEERNDEIGELSRAFNQMTANLKTVTASKVDLEKEIEDHDKAEKQLRTTLESIGDGFFACDADWRFIYVNAPAERILNIRREDVLGKSHWEVFPLTLGTNLEQEYHRAAAGEDRDFENYYESWGRWFHNRCFPREGGGMSVYFQDITEQKKAEEAIRRQQAEIQTLFENIPAGLVLFDASPPYEVLVHNRYYQQLFSEPFKSRGMTGLNIYQYAPEVEASGVAAVFKEVVQTKQRKSFLDFPYNANPSTKSWFNWYMAPIIIDDKVISLVSMSLDVTDRHIAEKALRESEERFRAIAETSPIQISVSRVADGTVLFVNKAYSDAFGYKPDELTGHKAIDLYADPSDRVTLVKALTEHGFIKDHEVRVKRADGTAFWLSTSVRTVNYAGESAYLGASIDITDRKKAEETLRETRDYLDNLFNYANAPIIVWNPDFEITRFNHAFEHLTGRTTDEVMGKKLDILFPDDSREESMDFIRKTPVGERWDVVEIPISHQSGAIRVVLWNSATVYGPDGKTAVATIAQGQDITERKKAEEELRRSNTELETSNKELESFSYSVSHDLRAPLRSMEGFSSALMEDYAEKLDEQGKKYLLYVKESSDLMGHLIDDLLKLSRVTRSEMNREEVDLTEIARKIAVELQKTEPTRKVKLEISSNMTTFGDRNLLRVVLENLLGNAWKFSSKTGSPRIEMGVAMHNGKQVYFIRDNGVGFEMAYADKLFKPFQRLHKASEFAGTGIGLATVQRIIQRHGGEVWAESKTGEGATFYFTLGQIYS